MKKGYILSFILGIVLCGTVIGVYAITASEITYNNTTVDSALDTLYTTQNTTVANLTSENSTLTQQNTTLTNQVSSLQETNSSQASTIQDLNAQISALTSSSDEIQYQTIDTGGYVSGTTAGTFSTRTVTIPQGKTKVYIFSDVSSTWGAAQPTVTGSIISSQTTTFLKDSTAQYRVNTNSYLTILDTTGTAGTLTIKFNCSGAANDSVHSAHAIVFYK